MENGTEGRKERSLQWGEMGCGEREVKRAPLMKGRWATSLSYFLPTTFSRVFLSPFHFLSWIRRTGDCVMCTVVVVMFSVQVCAIHNVEGEEVGS